MGTIWTLAHKDLTLVLRDRFGLFWMLVFPHGVPAVRWVLSLAAGFGLVAFLWRVRYHVIAAGYGRRQLSFNPLGTQRVEW